MPKPLSTLISPPLNRCYPQNFPEGPATPAPPVSKNSAVVLAVTNPECSDTLFDPDHVHGTDEVRSEKGSNGKCTFRPVQPTMSEHGPVVFVSSEPCCRGIVALFDSIRESAEGC
jgi:hypothetical protein